MQYGVHLPNFDLFGEAAVLAELAALCEQSGWDGVFIWDHLEWPGSEPAVDPMGRTRGHGDAHRSDPVGHVGHAVASS